MSTSDGGSAREPGAVRLDPGEQGSGTTGPGGSAPSRAEAQARAEEIHADVARTEVRRAEEQAARADDAVEEAERKQQAAHEAEERARRHAADVSEDADGAARRVSTTSLTSRRMSVGDQGDPIVFGPFTAEKPELLVAAAFVGAFVLAKIIRGMAR